MLSFMTVLQDCCGPTIYICVVSDRLDREMEFGSYKVTGRNIQSIQFNCAGVSRVLEVCSLIASETCNFVESIIYDSIQVQFTLWTVIYCEISRRNEQLDTRDCFLINEGYYFLVHRLFKNILYVLYNTTFYYYRILFLTIVTDKN